MPLTTTVRPAPSFPAARSFFMPRYGVSPASVSGANISGFGSGWSAYCDDVAVRRHQVLGETTGRSESDELSSAAELLVAFVALPTYAVAPVRVDHDEVALRQTRRIAVRRRQLR